MKTILCTLTLSTLLFSATSQENDKNFRFGLKMSPSFNWLKIDDTKTFAKNGIAMKFGYGLITEFHLAGSAWLSTGLQVDYDGGKIKTTSTDPYVDNTSGKVFFQYDANNGLAEYDNTTNGYKTYWLRERVYKTTYVTLPIQLRMRTKEIGSMTYFGNFGINASFHLKTRVTDVAHQTNSGGGLGYQSASEEIENVISDDMNPLRFGLVLGGGAEMNLSGSTSLLFGLNFFQGLPIPRKKNQSIYLMVKKQRMPPHQPIRPLHNNKSF